MIRSDSSITPTRRIAVIGIPRPQQTRLGMIRPARSGEPLGWCTVSDEGPESSANFLATASMRQRAATQQTPGTLLYTPACYTPAENLAPWNSSFWTPYRDRTNRTSHGIAGGTGFNQHLFWMALTVAASVAAASLIAKGRR
jgi:hypothetical protein